MELDAQAVKPVSLEVPINTEMIAAYAARVGDTRALASDCSVAPLTFVLSIRRGFSPDVPLPPDSFAMYGGHDLTFHRAMHAGQTYRVQARIVDTYEKSGRSGRMWIVVRRADVSDPTGRPVAEMVERQVVRRRSSMEKQGKDQAAQGWPAVDRHRPTNHTAPAGQPILSPDIGDELGPLLRQAPDAARIAGYADENHVYENLFVDPGFARRLGYRDVIVPGPMQTAFLEQFLQQQLPGFTLESISVTFRMSVIGGDPLSLSGVVTELDEGSTGTRITCDVMIANADGERATIGQATLRRDDRSPRAGATSL